MSINKAASFTAADSIPVKLFLQEGVSDLQPIHIQWIPTNRCNLNCDFCSCSNRDHSLEMDPAIAQMVIADFARLGCKAVTITGGGEPLCHKHLADMIQGFYYHRISVGLVTNGLLFDKLDRDTIERLTWCRISNHDRREFTDVYRRILERVVEIDSVDWAFSHVVSTDPNIQEIRRIVQFANEHDLTHVRLVSDLFCPEKVDQFWVKESLQGIDERVVYQPRQNAKRGGKCWIGYVKPLIGPDWSITPCCGCQYALDPPTRDLPRSMIIGDARELDRMYGGERTAWRFPCVRCYYNNYNDILDAMQSDVMHKEFI